MLRNYLLLTWRFFKRHRSYVLINLFGLGTAFSSAIMAFILYQYNWEFDRFHEKRHQVYRITSEVNDQGNRFPIENSPQPMAQWVRDSLPEATGAVGYQEWNGTYAQAQGEPVPTRSAFADHSAFFELFTFPLLSGSPAALDTATGIYLSQNVAQQLFGDSAALGQTLTYRFTNGSMRKYPVLGVMQNCPQGSSLQFNVLLPYRELLSLNELEGVAWSRNIQATFVEIPEPNALPAAMEALEGLLPRQQQANPRQPIQSLKAYPVARMARGNFWQYHMRRAMGSGAFQGAGGMALLFLLIALFNFVNTSVVLAGRRIKEIAVRKTLGATQWQIIVQFLGESMALVALGLLVGIAYVTGYMPFYNARWPSGHMEFNLFTNRGMWLFLLGIYTTTTLLAGGYPAFYLGRFQPVNILKRKVRHASNNWLGLTLLTGQFVLALIAISATLLFVMNNRFINTLDYGYAYEKLLLVRVGNATEYNTMAKATQGLPQVSHVAGSRGFVGMGLYPGRASTAEGKSFEAFRYRVGPHYLETIGLTLVQGKPFHAMPPPADSLESWAVINQAMADTLGYSNPVGQLFYGTDSLPYRVCGVVQNFYPIGPFVAIQPTLFQALPEDEFRNLTIRVSSAAQVPEVKAQVEALWQEHLPETPMDFMDPSGALVGARRLNGNLTYSMLAMGVVVTLLSLSGLYALVGLNLLRRTKEIGVRKALGGSMRRIAWQINRSFVWVMLAACVVGTPVSILLVDGYLDTLYRHHVAFTLWPALLAIALMLGTVGLSMFFLIRRALLRNPVDSLKDE